MQFANSPSLALSVVLVSYNMARELPRTIRSLTHQTGIDADCYEIIVVDNGSAEVDVGALLSINPRLRFFKLESPSVSPVPALNFGISMAAGHLICACIDAARMLTPGMLSHALAASFGDRTIVGSFSFHLGHQPQNESVKYGYNQTAEDALLKTIDWERDLYSLFDISSFDPSSRFGLFTCPAETNALFMGRSLWEETGGFDERFKTKGGGLANLDLWTEVCADARNKIVLLWGEGTFHQFHGGVATNAVLSQWDVFNEEYKSIRGRYFEQPNRNFLLFGTTNEHFHRFISNRLDPPKKPSAMEGMMALSKRGARFIKRLFKRSDNQNWRRCPPLLPLIPRRTIDGGWTMGFGQIWRRKRPDGGWEYRQDAETEDEWNTRQW